MIKVMETETVRVELGPTVNEKMTVIVTVTGTVEKPLSLTVDQFAELTDLARVFYNANDMYEYTTEADNRREEWKRDEIAEGISMALGRQAV